MSQDTALENGVELSSENRRNPPRVPAPMCAINLAACRFTNLYNVLGLRSAPLVLDMGAIWRHGLPVIDVQEDSSTRCSRWVSDPDQCLNRAVFCLPTCVLGRGLFPAKCRQANGSFAAPRSRPRMSVQGR